MHNAILRWTIGPVNEDGFRTLSRSVNLAKKIYKNFYLCICHNGLNKKQKGYLEALKVDLIEQDAASLICSPSGVAWKLYPPRLNIQRHEIFIDNDLLLYKPLEEINWFLEQNDAFIICEALRRLFGSRDGYVPKGLKINSGLFGIPPHFDFAQAINNMGCWKDRFDEQGTVAAIVCQHNYKIIPLTKISVCYEDFVLGTHGIHFCGVNSGLIKNWNKFLTYKSLC